MEASDPDGDLRQRAIANLEAKRDFFSHLAIYAALSVLMVVIYFATGGEGFFWPAIPIAAWLIFGIIPHWWTVYKSAGIPEDKIKSEMDKIRSQR